MAPFDDDPEPQHHEPGDDPDDIALDAEGAWGLPRLDLSPAASPPPSEAQPPVSSVDFDAIYKEQRPFVLGLMARRKDITPASAQDLAQIALLQLSKQMDAKEPVQNVQAMLVTILGHVICNRGRVVRADVDPDADLEAQEKPEADLDPEETADFVERKRILDVQLEGMKEQEAAVIRFIELFELSFTQTAKLLEIPRGTVATLHHRAMAKLEAGIRAQVSGRRVVPHRRTRP